MEKRLVFLSIAICLFFTSCVVVAQPSVPAETEQPEFAATEAVPVNTNTPDIPAETATPTLLPTSIVTSLPTIDKHPPTPTVERPVEWDIDPYIEYEIEGEYKGVKIKASVIIDRSLEPLVEGIYVNKNLLSEVIAKSLAYVWFFRHGDYTDINNLFQYERITSDQMDRWFGLWAKAQETGLEYYWRQVQLDNIRANDLNDGNGYVQKPYSFWLMYDGPTPYGITAIDKITIVMLDTPKADIRNVTVIRAMTGVVVASNLDEKRLFFYTGKDMSYYIKDGQERMVISRERLIKTLLRTDFYSLDEYLVWNDGNTDFSSTDLHFSATLEMGRLFERAVEYKVRIE